jgi:methylmalonyl-CoA/ethylmalonyl-CoA epimerase
MIGRLNHVAIAVRDIGKAAALYRDVLGADVSAAVPQPDHGVTTVFITLPNTKIELLEPLGENSPIAKFLERYPDGGMHHVCYEVEDIRAARHAQAVGGARPWRRRAAHRRPRQAGPVPAPEGFFRHLGRAGTALEHDPKKWTPVFRKVHAPLKEQHAGHYGHRHLFPDLVGGAVRGAALGRPQPA